MIRVYRYGLLPPTKGEALVIEQLSLANRYYNVLTKIERDRRNTFRWFRYERPDYARAEDELEAVTEELERARQVIRNQRASTRSRSDTRAQRDRVRDLSARRREVKAVRDRIRSAAHADMTWESLIIEAIARERRIAARASSLLAWGTYMLAEEAHAMARKEPSDPAFRPWRGTGSIGVQIQQANQPMSVEKLLACEDSRLQIDPTPTMVPNRIRSAKGLPRFLPRVRLRVGSDEHSKPIWAEWPVILHRDIPADAKVVWAKVLRSRVGPHWRWSLHLTLHLPNIQPDARAPEGAVAVDLGWRRVDDSLRAGYVRDAERGYEIQIDPGFVRDMAKVRDLRSIRDRSRAELTEWLIPWLRAHLEAPKCIPTWIADELEHMHAWRSLARFSEFALAWRSRRWDGDTEAFDRLEAWRKQDRHLWTWESHLRDQALRRRLDGYRVLAARLAKSYRTLVIEDLDLREFQRHRPVEDDVVENQNARAQQPLVSPSELRSCLISAFEGRGGTVEAFDPAYTTRRCHFCGSECKWDQAASLRHTCEWCGTTWDQDDNACRNLLFLHRERLGGGQNDGVARVSDFGAIVVEREAKWRKKGRHAKSDEDRSQDGAEVVEKKPDSE